MGNDVRRWEVGISVNLTEIMNIVYPFSLHGPGAGARFSAHNDPVNAVKADFSEVLDERFQRQKFDRRPRPPKVVYSGLVEGALNTDAHPKIGRPRESL